MPKSDPEIASGAFKLYDAYAHGALSRRDFLDGLKAYAIGGLTVSVLAAALMPDYANAQQTDAGDPRLTEEDMLYASPNGAGEMSGYLVRPASAETPRGGVLVIHENRGLNPHIRDVARRAALAGYVAFAPDALHPLGGYPGTDDEGRTLQRQRDGRKMLQDFIAGAHVLRDHPACTGQVAAVGFCYGGAVANQLAVRLDWLAGSVPFYGGWPEPENAEAVNVPLQIHLAALDDRVNAGWPVWRDALDAAGAPYEVFMYEGAQHGFHNDTTARFDPQQAELAWSRTLDFFEQVLNA